MKPEGPPTATVTPAAAAAADKPPRFAPKLLIVAGAAAVLLVALSGTAAVLLWPKAEDKPADKVATAKAARKAAAAASAASAAAAAAAASAASTTHAAASAATAATNGIAASSAAATVVAASAAAASATAAAPAETVAARNDGDVAPAKAAEEPMDRLRRRLGQVLGSDPVSTANGELRVLARSASVAPVSHPAGSPRTTAADAATAARSPHAGPWSYEGRSGPQAWGRLDPAFAACATGKRQSPIDIRDGLPLDLDPVQFDYQSGSFGVIDTGHTVQVNVAPGSSIELQGRRWELREFHFHRPSEERVNGRQFEMDVHLVHRDAEGRIAVVAVLLERGPAQPVVQQVWNNLPLEKGVEQPARSALDPGQLLPADRRYYTYMGSLTTPPCSEGVLWVVMQQPVQMSAQQIDIFSRLYPMNARPIQQAAGRMIKQSN